MTCKKRRSGRKRAHHASHVSSRWSSSLSTFKDVYKNVALAGLASRVSPFHRPDHRNRPRILRWGELNSPVAEWSNRGLMSVPSKPSAKIWGEN
eukprot:7369674-Pyramimonas_sp.AAC.1